MHAPTSSSAACCGNAQCLLLLHHEACTGHYLLSTLAFVHWTCNTSFVDSQTKRGWGKCGWMCWCIFTASKWHAGETQCCYCSCLHVSPVFDIAETALVIRGLFPAALASATICYICVMMVPTHFLCCHCLQIAVHLTLNVHIGSWCNSTRRCLVESDCSSLYGSSLLPVYAWHSTSICTSYVCSVTCMTFCQYVFTL